MTTNTILQESKRVRLASLEKSNLCIRHLLKSVGGFLDALHFPIAIINIEGRYVYYNKESAEVDGCSQEFALGNLLLNVYPNMVPEESTMLNSLYTGASYSSHEQNYFNARGKLLNYMHTTTPIFNNENEIVGSIEIGWDVSQVAKLQNQILSLTKQLKASKNNVDSYDELEIVTASPLMIKVLENAKRLAMTSVPVVIFGESGTGKELVAKYIKLNSPRKDKPFVTLNCGALTESLIDSSLFGSVKGAYTGADNSPGYLEFADGGTLFLDEFNSMPQAMQVKLLRFLQDKTFQRVGSPKLKKSDVRIIVAMNEHPQRLIQEGRLRADLFWRISVGQLHLPPLRERREDIPLLIDYFIRKHATAISYNITGITQEALEEVYSQSWPGNIRMLENAILRAMVLQESDGPILHLAHDMSQSLGTVKRTRDYAKQLTVDRLKKVKIADVDTVVNNFENSGDGKSLEDRIREFEMEIIRRTLEKTNGNVSKASAFLKINRSTLNYKLQKYAIPHGVQLSNFKGF